MLPAETELLDLIVYKATRTSPKSSYVSRNLWLLFQMYALSSSNRGTDNCNCGYQEPIHTSVNYSFILLTANHSLCGADHKG